ncbi:5097_t:CDS:2, partial [Gigaspora rosea]
CGGCSVFVFFQGFGARSVLCDGPTVVPLSWVQVFWVVPEFSFAFGVLGTFSGYGLVHV